MLTTKLAVSHSRHAINNLESIERNRTFESHSKVEVRNDSKDVLQHSDGTLNTITQRYIAYASFRSATSISHLKFQRRSGTCPRINRRRSCVKACASSNIRLLFKKWSDAVRRTYTHTHPSTSFHTHTHIHTTRARAYTHACIFFSINTLTLNINQQLANNRLLIGCYSRERSSLREKSTRKNPKSNR